MVLPVIGGMLADRISLFSVPVYYPWWWERNLARQQQAPSSSPAHHAQPTATP